MTLEPVADLADPRLDDYRNVPDPALLRGRGVFVAEGRLVVRALLRSRRFRTRSILVTDSALAGLHDALGGARDPLPIYVASKQLMTSVVGFNVHRGCLAIGERPEPEPLDVVLPPEPAGALVVVLEGVGNADNVGGVFRNAAAFGADAVVLSPGCCDPLYRKAVRVSIGATLAVPFTTVAAWPGEMACLRDSGFVVLALTPGPGSVDINAARPPWSPGTRIALVAGNEGRGLTEEALQAADWRVRIPMAAGADSLNVATSVGIALHRLSSRVVRARPR